MPTKAGGCAANVAIDLAKQDIKVEVAGCVGRDGAAETLRQSLEKRGVGCKQVIPVDDAPTSRTVILLVEGQDRRYIHFFGANTAFTIKHIPRPWVAGLKVFYLGGLCVLPGIKTGELASLLKFCREKGVTTVVDVVVPQGFTAANEINSLLPHIDYFLPNNDEAEILTGTSDPAAQLRALLAKGAHTVIVTQGPNGAMAARGKQFWRANAYPSVGIDPSGAGDAFASGVITGIVREWSIPEMIRYGSALGSSATRAIGTTDGVFKAREAEDFVRANHLAISVGSL
jgi:sugar/nucleoside kinase (ribokinase family)